MRYSLLPAYTSTRKGTVASTELRGSPRSIYSIACPMGSASKCICIPRTPRLCHLHSIHPSSDFIFHSHFRSPSFTHLLHFPITMDSKTSTEIIENVALSDFDDTTRRAERKLRTKIDLYVVPTVALLYLMCFIDRANIGEQVPRGEDRRKIVLVLTILQAMLVLLDLKKTSSLRDMTTTPFSPSSTSHILSSRFQQHSAAS